MRDCDCGAWPWRRPGICLLLPLAALLLILLLNTGPWSCGLPGPCDPKLLRDAAAAVNTALLHLHRQPGAPPEEPVRLLRETLRLFEPWADVQLVERAERAARKEPTEPAERTGVNATDGAGISLLLLASEDSWEQTAAVAAAAQAAYPGLSVLMATDRSQPPALESVQQVAVKREALVERPGQAWTALLARVATPLALLGRDLAAFAAADARLGRLAAMLTEPGPELQLLAAGGASRANDSGRWRLGCHQSEIRSYRLSYSEGYRHSAKDCALCDHLSGPFVARTEQLRALGFDLELPAHAVFEDLFLRARARKLRSAVCPDELFHTRSLAGDVALRPLPEPRAAWLPLARRHRLCSVLLPPTALLLFSPAELRLSCNAWAYGNKGYLLPSCCLSQVARALRRLEQMRQQRGLRYHLDSGSVLGAVKMSAYPPWDLDGDVSYESSQEELIKSVKGKPFRLRDEKKPSFAWFLPDLYLDVHPGPASASTTELPPELPPMPTLVQVLGVWVPAPDNPGRYAMDMYGPGILAHAPWHDSRPGGKGWNSGQWPRCRDRSRHDCLDAYPAEGSLDYAPMYFDNMGLPWLPGQQSLTVLAPSPDEEAV